MRKDEPIARTNNIRCERNIGAFKNGLLSQIIRSISIIKKQNQFLTHHNNRRVW